MVFGFPSVQDNREVTQSWQEKRMRGAMAAVELTAPEARQRNSWRRRQQNACGCTFVHLSASQASSVPKTNARTPHSDSRSSPCLGSGLSLVFMLGGVHFSIGVPADPSILILFSVSHAVSQRPRKCKQHKHKHGQIQQRKVKEIRWWKPCTIKCKVMSNRVFRPEGP